MISIITPLYNSAQYIPETIGCVLAQSYTNWEILIVDDCSNDNGVEIVKNFRNIDYRIKLIQNEKKLGPAFSRNIAIEAAQGKYIAFLDSDDLWYPNKLEVQLDFMIKNDLAFTYTAYDKISENGSFVGHIDVPMTVSYNDLLKTCSIGCLTAMYDVSKLGKIYMPLIEKRQDFALWLKILKIVPKAYGLNLTLGKYRLRNKSISSNKIKVALYQWKVYREIERLSFFKSVYYFSHYFFFGIIKTYFK